MESDHSPGGTANGPRGLNLYRNACPAPTGARARRRVRLCFVESLPRFVMLNEVKHLANEGNRRLLPCLTQILRCRSELALSVAEGMTRRAHCRHEI